MSYATVLKLVRNNVNFFGKIIYCCCSASVQNVSEGILMMCKGILTVILMCKQVTAFLKVQLCGLEGLLAWVDALSLSESCREGALPR